MFRYRTRCGTVYGHTGNTAGYTQFIAATRDGSRSVSVSVSATDHARQPPRRLPGPPPGAAGLAMSAAMARSRECPGPDSKPRAL